MAEFAFIKLEDVETVTKDGTKITPKYELKATGAAQKRLIKELRDYWKDPTEGISAGPIKPDNLYEWRAVMVGPPSSPYAGGIFKLLLTCPTDYPFKQPKFQWVTPMYHCNFNEKGGICNHSDNWSPAFTAMKCLVALQASLIKPQIEDDNDPNRKVVCMCVPRPEIANLYKKNRVTHDKNARDWTRKYAS